MVTGAASTADLTKLVERFRHAQRDIDKFAQDVLEETGQEIADRMRAYVPVKTGALRNSIRVITEPGKVQIGPVGIEYAGWVEYGTGTRGEIPRGMYEIKPVRAEKLTFRINGQWITTKKVNHPGIRPKPYIRPAAAEVFTNLGVKFEEAGRRAFK